MDILNIVSEIGIYQTGINIANVMESEEIRKKVGACMPLPNKNIADSTKRIAKWIMGFGKNKFIFLNPDIAIIQELGNICSDNSEAIILIPNNLEEEAKERLRNNVPRNIKVSVSEETYFPKWVFPENGIMIICGYSAGGRALVLSDTYRMLEHHTSTYNGFYGKKVFIPYVELEAAYRFDGWMEISGQKISDIWRDDYE